MEQNNLSEVAFFGKITAAITHELKNVLAVIKETSGLMGDILSLTDAQTFQHKEKFNKALSTIQRQIEHGVDLLTRLNKFAHCPDKETAEIDLNSSVDELIALCRRFARLKNIELFLINSERPFKFTTCQISLQMLLFSCLEYCISHLPQGTKIDMKVEKGDSDGEYLIIFDCSHELSGIDMKTKTNSYSNDLEKLHKMAVLTHGKLSSSPCSITLSLSPQV